LNDSRRISSAAMVKRTTKPPHSKVVEKETTPFIGKKRKNPP
jgi:hypothetical protein